ncbi:MAG TPA: molecular chaperone DnaJ [Acidimicrobiia bacterium]|nr:molecular chaperone DnaJ [Acidimicrobiia bacterium]
MPTDYYEILGVARNATADDIKRAYRVLARAHHPDANPGDAAAEARFKEVSVAYETLRDPERRRRYEMFGPEGSAGGSGRPGADGFGGLGDVFDAFFGGDPFGRGGPAGPMAGSDIEAELHLTLDDVVFGATKPLDVRLPVPCETCDGSGCEAGTHPARCETCDGAGQVRQVRRSLLGQIVTAGACPHCGGAGSVIPSPCRACSGEGRVIGDRRLDVEVPPGIDNGQRLRLAGRGVAAPRGGPPGDLYVQVRVASHPAFERHGNDLLHALSIGVAQAALGTACTIETLDGPEELVIPAGTQPGRVFRLRNRGVPVLQGRGRGDLLVHIAVGVPERLSDEETELFRELARSRGEDVEPQQDGRLFSRIRSAFQ